MNKTLLQKTILITTITTILLVGPLTATGSINFNPFEAFAQSVEPDMVKETLGPGEMITVEKTVTTGLTPPKPDIYMLADTTGSMFSVISQVKSDMMTIQSDVKAMEPTAQFGVGEYKDFPFDAFAFQHLQAITADDVAVDNAANTLFASGGADGSEGQFFALDEIANNPGLIGWRADSTRIVVWFGDAPAHDPVCTAISGLAFDIDEASVIADLQAAGITVVAISTTTGFFNGLNDNPTISAGNYIGFCVIDGAAGQADRITAATGGSHQANVAPADITQAIINSIEEITIDVVPDASDCTDQGLEVTFIPPTQEDVPPDTSVMFDEKITVPEDTEVEAIHCEILFRAGDGGILATEEVWITIPQIEIDIKPTSCPNPINTKSKGVIPVAILGSATFDVNEVDVSTVQLEGIAPIRSSIEDVATPFGGDLDNELSCTEDGADGFLDLTLKFKTQDIITAIGPVADGDVLVLELTGDLLDGTSFAAQDIVIIRDKGKP